jgi:hypothetical protein
MSTELLNYCLEQLLAHPRALNISVPLSSAARNSFTRFWSKARFEVQQQSILTLLPDDPLYGRGYLWPYELIWHEDPKDASSFLLRIQYNLLAPASPRELILLASVSESAVPFLASKALFTAARTRMLGKDSKRMSGAVHLALRSGVAAVQYSYQGGTGIVSAVHFPDVVDIEN